MTQARQGWLWTIGAILWMMFILFALLTPPPDIEVGPGMPDWIDKIVHLVLFAIWAMLLVMASWESFRSIKYMAIGIVILIVSIGTELLQTLTANRSGEILDALADIIGGCLILIALRIWKKA